MHWEQKGFAVVSKTEIPDGASGVMPFFHDFCRTEWEALAKKGVVENLPEELRKDLVILPCKLTFEWSSEEVKP